MIEEIEVVKLPKRRKNNNYIVPNINADDTDKTVRPRSGSFRLDSNSTLYSGDTGGSSFGEDTELDNKNSFEYENSEDDTPVEIADIDVENYFNEADDTIDGSDKEYYYKITLTDDNIEVNNIPVVSNIYDYSDTSIALTFEEVLEYYTLFSLLVNDPLDINRNTDPDHYNTAADWFVDLLDKRKEINESIIKEVKINNNVIDKIF